MKRIIIKILLLMSGITAWSQTDRLDSLLMDVLGNEKEFIDLINPSKSFSYLYGGVNAYNRSLYAGRELGDNMYNANGSIYFFHSKGFFAGVSGLWYDQLVPQYNATIASAGINLPVNRTKSIHFRASYNRYFYNQSDTAEESVFNNSISTGVSIRNKWIGGRISMNFLFGQDFGMNFTPVLFSNIGIIRFGKYNKVRIEPELSVYIGSETVELEKSGNMTEQQTEDTYGILNTQFYLPLCLYIGNVDLELGYAVNIPATRDDDIDYPVTSFFSFSFGFLLPLN